MRDWLPWLLALGAAVLGVAWLLRRPGRRPGSPDGTLGRPGRGGPLRRPPTPVDGRPGPGEIWWADVPYEDASGSKVRPCLVLRADPTGADVLKITSQDKSRRSDYIQIPTRPWDPQAEHDSFLSLSDPVRLSSRAFGNRAGICEPELWSWISRMPHLRRTA